MQVTDHFNGKIFLNPVPTEVMGKGAIWRLLGKAFQKHPHREPAKSPGPFSVDHDALRTIPDSALRVTWLGHSSLLIDVDGKRFLTDPLWYQRASPFRYLGPRRFFPNPLSLEALPHIDAVLLSHDHYDHLDRKSILHLTQKNIPVITMLGVGKRLLQWGISPGLVTELDWWDAVPFGGEHTITAAPARHFSGRGLTDRFSTLWGSFAIKGPLHRVFYGADSGYFNGFVTIGENLGPFDLALLEIGAYNEEWEAIHMGPENAVQAALDLKAAQLMPIHWGTFNLAMHPWTEPVERLLDAAAKKDVSLVLPAPGDTTPITGNSHNSGWWKKYH
ncbi:MBL fold metallo-hydrolase [Flavisolibacter nicotianae]|uniref:MBL fold metallo-hydrolase n=1 Tax=Flavisolibacter nicotianae TaxID=2364882 RepID=UPI000EB1E80D|nr:MBL fold metallo-hydrolase [Flavisolibacter nicotianae]